MLEVGSDFTSGNLIDGLLELEAWGSFLIADAAKGCLVPPSSDLIDDSTAESGDECWGNAEESFPWMSCDL